MSELFFENALRGSRAYALMRSDIERGLSHAYMVISADDELTDSFFTLCGMTLFCQNGDACGECAECRKVLHSSHADIIHVNVERSDIKRDDVMELVGSVAVRALGKRKIYFIHRADLMNAVSQNKLLKTLEEPPENVTLFLGVANERAMLATVRSRTRAIYLDSFDESVIYDELIRLGKDEKAAAVASACSDGMPGRALLIADSPEYVSYYNGAVALLEGLNRSSDVADMSARVCAVKDIDEFLNVLSIIIRDMIIFKHSPEKTMSGQLGGGLEALSAKYGERALAAILFEINNVRKKLKLNVNLQASIDSLLFSMLEVKHKWQ